MENEPPHETQSPIFVSYSHEDRASVQLEIDWLKSQGFNVWYDDGIRPGSSWRSEIAESIEACSLFLFFLTPRSAGSVNCEREVNYATDINKRILAVHLEETELSSGFKLTLNSQQAIFKHGLADTEYRTKMLNGINGQLLMGEARDPSRQFKYTGNKAIAVVVLLALISIGSWFFFVPDTTEQYTSDQQIVGLNVLESVTNSDPRPSIAVMPFKNLSSDPEQIFFSEGLSEDILNGLVQFPKIRVVGRASSFGVSGENANARQLGRVLGVGHIVTGSVRKSNNRIRVTAQLVSTHDDAHIWSEKFDRELTDVFKVQDEITEAVLSALIQEFEPKRSVSRAPTSNTEAYNAYLAGRYLFNRLEFKKAAAAFQTAIALDPEYANAYQGLASAYSFYVWWGIKPPDEMIPLIKENTEKALQLESEHTVALSSHALLRFFTHGEERQIQIDKVHQLMSQHPNNGYLKSTYMTMLTAVSRHEQAVSLARQSLALDPQSPAAHRQLAEQLMYVGQFDEAKIKAKKAEELGLGVATLLATISTVELDLPGLKVQLDRGALAWGNGAAFKPMFQVGYDYQNGNTVAAFFKLFKFWLSPASDSPRAQQLIHLIMGDIEGSLDYVEQSVNAVDFYVIRNIRGSKVQRERNPDYYTHPRFEEILRVAGLDDESIAQLKFPE